MNGTVVQALQFTSAMEVGLSTIKVYLTPRRNTSHSENSLLRMVGLEINTASMGSTVASTLLHSCHCTFSDLTRSVRSS
jgi:hypothetical protein